MKKPSILLIDDDDSLRRVIEFSLVEAGYKVKSAASGEEGLRVFDKDSVDAVVTDITMPGMNGIEVLAKIRERNDQVPVVIITAYGTIENAVNAMKQGAFDYITKPFNRDELRITLDKALRMRKLEKENRELRSVLTDRYHFGNIIAISGKMTSMLEIASRVAPSDASVLITGESGTGKELLAKGIHYNSSRADGPFIAVNAAAIPENLVESELFGHVKGAFTGAIRDREGKFEQASGGTLFLDEIGDLRVDLQAKILRTLQEKQVDPVGGSGPVPVDVRIIAATNKDIEAAVREGKFREDLYYRLGVITLAIPPLRERREDIQLLIDHFLKKFNPGADVHLEPEAASILSSYGWPGNVRELENVIQRASVLRKGNTIAPSDLPDKFMKGKMSVENIILNLPDEGISLEDLEKNLIIKALEKHKGNQTRAAEYLGITRPTLIYRIEKYGIK